MVATAARLHQLPACGEASRSSFTVPPRLGKASAMEPKASFTLDGFFHFQLLTCRGPPPHTPPDNLWRKATAPRRG